MVKGSSEPSTITDRSRASTASSNLNNASLPVQFPTVNGIKIGTFSTDKELLRYIDHYQEGLLISVNTEIVMKTSPPLRKIINNHIGYADGIGPIWALRKKGYKVHRIPGVELWLKIIEQYYQDKSFYLIGSTEQVIQDTVKKLRQQYPPIDIVNYHHGYLDEQDRRDIKANIKKVQPDIVLIAMGFPRQEYLMQELYKEHKALYMGLGGSFDVFTGKKQRAPRIVQNLNSEWLFRLLKEPTRFKRQLAIIKFLYLFLLNKL